MFKRLTTSLSRPPQTVFFMKDSWGRIILYVLLLPIILIIPMLITTFVDPNMSITRYALLTQAIEEDFRIENAAITDGVLTYQTATSASFETIFSIYLGNQNLNSKSFNFVFEQNDLVLYIADVEMDRESYVDLNLLNHDFSSTDPDNLRSVNLALKSFIERQPMVITTDIIINYTFALFDYLFVTLLMSLMMLIFVTKVQFPYLMRFKLSVYLTTVWMVSELILSLFNVQYLDFVSVLLVYIYHVIAYRSIRVIKKGVI